VADYYFRGGAWSSTDPAMLIGTFFDLATVQHDDIGLRCARDAPL
jgi:hypothetical protein